MMEAIQRKQLEESFRQEFEWTLADRVARYLDVKPHEIVPNKHFAPVSAECALLFRDGHFYGCIAMTQAVAEALARFLCERNSMRVSKDFGANVERLKAKQVITEGLTRSLLQIGDKRNDYHHLNNDIERDRKVLEQLARQKAKLLVEVESEVFRYKIVEGTLVRENPQYWEPADDLGMSEVYLRLEP